MKSIATLLLIAALHANAASVSYVNFVRQNQQGTGVVWDKPVASEGTGSSALAMESGGSLFQLWTIEQSSAKDYLLDQKLVGAYLPVADIRIITLDPDSVTPRTRVDQPFTVEIDVSGLLSGTGLPLASTTVLLERHIANYPADPVTGNVTTGSLDPAQVTSGKPLSSGYITSNGKTVLKFPATALTATDPTKALGEEHFVVHALSDGTITQSQIASAHVEVWPVASGSIKGINNGDVLRFQAPKVEILLNDLYPRSDTYLLLFEGTQVNGVDGTVVVGYPMDRPASESKVIRIPDLDSKLTKDGTYTLAVVSDTVYGRELLGPTVTFSVNRTLKINAMQVNLSDNTTP